MKIFLQLIQNYLNQEVPTIILTIDKQKYIFNMASCFQRFIKDHRQKFPSGSRIFFTKANTDTLAGLSGFMLTIFQNKNCQDTKLYVNDKLYDYLQEIRYKMGFKMLPYSYMNMFTNQHRSGIKNISHIYELLEKQEFPQIFLNSQNYIKDNFGVQDRNQASRFYDMNIKQFNDGTIRIKGFQIQSNNQKITNYICIPNKLQGKVLMNKVKQFKIPPQLISKVLNQGSLILENGQQVKAQSIKQPDQPSPNFLILHHASVQSVELILKHPIFIQYIKNKENQTNSVIHIIQNPPTNQRIVQSDAFRFLINSFDNDVNHIIYNRHYRNENYDPTIQPIPKHIQLASFVHKYFPTCMPDILGQHTNYVKQHWDNCSILEKLYPQNRMFVYKRCHQLILAPKKSQGYFMMQDQGKQKQKRQLICPQNIKKGKQLQQIIKSHNQFLPFDCSSNNAQVVFLGTGSMKPSKYRNVSAIYIQMSPLNSILFDCGEGSYYQLFNHFGKQKIDEILLNIRTIFITHIHSDHNLGILDLIAERNKLLKRKYNYTKINEQNKKQIKIDRQAIDNNKIFLIIPFNVLPWFHSYISNIQNLLEGCQLVFVQTILGEQLDLSDGTVSKDQRIISKEMQLERNQSEMVDEKDEKQQSEKICQKQTKKVKIYFNHYLQKLHQIYYPQQQLIHSKFNNYLKEVGITKFLPVHVDHCPQSFAIVIQHISGTKISYSGDCRPSLDFAKEASGSTLMIHEATFGDDLQQNARENMHSTVGQALQIAMKSQSWKLALTHFSQRYISAKQIINPSVYKFDEKKRNFAQNHTITCFDHLRMRMSQLPQMTYYSKKICQIFPSDSQE